MDSWETYVRLLNRHLNLNLDPNLKLDNGSLYLEDQKCQDPESPVPLTLQVVLIPALAPSPVPAPAPLRSLVPGLPAPPMMGNKSRYTQDILKRPHCKCKICVFPFWRWLILPTAKVSQK